MEKFLTLPVLLVAGAGVYFYFYLKRMAKTAGLAMDSPGANAVTALAALVTAAFAADIWGLSAVVILHTVVFGLFMDFLNVVAGRAGRRGKGWRVLYGSGVVPILATALVLVYGFWNMNHVRRTDYTVYTEKPIRQEGYLVCLVSDLHYGDVVNREDLEGYCREIKAADPDLLILDGDIVDERTTKEQLSEVFSVFSTVNPDLGTYYVYGNHDRGLYSKQSDFTPEELRQAILEAGIRILSDETETVNGELTLIGREDRTNPPGEKRADGEKLLAQTDQENFLLLLDHQPRDLEKNAALGYDLQLSGHTHGGQIWPVGEISDLLGFGEMNYGYRSIGDFQVIVSSGMAGWGYPIRTGKRSEYVMIRISGAPRTL